VGWAAIDRVDEHQCFINGFRHHRYIPEALRPFWIRAVDIIMARIHEATTDLERDRAVKWWFLASDLLMRRDGGRGRRSYVQWRARLIMFVNGKYDELIDDYANACHNVPNQHYTRTADEHAALRRALHLAKVGEMSAARRILDSHGLADISSAEVVAMVKEQLGQEYDFPIPELADLGISDINIEQLNVRQILARWRREKAKSPNGMYPEHLKVVATSRMDAADRAMEGYSRYVTALANGDLQPWASQMAAAVSLIALLKGDTLTDGIRTIGVQMMDQQVACKALMERHKDAAKQFTEPYQIAVGTHDAGGKLVTAVRLLLEAHPEACVATLDVKNMFPSLPVGEVLRRLGQELPRPLQEITVALWTMHKFTPLATLGGKFAPDVRGDGLLMGNALSAFAASVATLGMIREAQESLRTQGGNDWAIVRGQIDDLTLVAAEPDHIATTIQQVLTPHLEELGTTLHPLKRGYFYAGDSSTEALEALGVRRLEITDENGEAHRGVTISGIAMGSAGYIRHTLNGIVGDIKRSYDNIAKLMQYDAHAVLALIQSTMNNRFNHWLRSQLPSEITDHIRDLDAAHVQAYELCSDLPLSSDDMLKDWFFSPVRHNGAGAVLSSNVADAAFVGAFLDVVPTMFDARLMDGVHSGFLTSASMSQTLAPDGAFDSGADGPCFAAIINHTRIGRDFADAYRRLQNRFPAAQRPEMLQPEPHSARGAGRHSQRILSHAVEQARAVALEAEMTNRSLEDPMSNAYFARQGSQSASAIFKSRPGQHKSEIITADMLKIILQRLFGQRLSILTGLVGNRIGTTDHVVDPYGRRLAGVKLPGNSDTQRHDKVLFELIKQMRAMRIEANREPHRLFSHLLTPDVRRREYDRVTAKGIIPDIAIQLGSGAPIIGDVKTVGDVASFAKRSRREPAAKQFAVNKREGDVLTQYKRVANAIDREQGHGDPTLEDPTQTPPSWYDDPAHHGPVRRRLEEFKLYGLVVGPRGECSKGLVHLVERACAIGAINLGDEIPVATTTSAESFLRWHVYRCIGMTTQRAMAQHLLDRLHYAQPGGVTRARTDARAREASFGYGGIYAAYDEYRDSRFGNAGARADRQDYGGRGH
jgi:hypothetical protein